MTASSPSPESPPLADTPPPAAGQVIRAATPASEGWWRRGTIPRTPSKVTAATKSMEPYGRLPSLPPDTVWVIRYETPTTVDGEVTGTVPGSVWLRQSELYLIEMAS